MDWSCPRDASRAAAMNLRMVKRRGDDKNVDPGASDDGFSLVEVVITIVLIGIVVIPLLIASASSITASSRTREASETETVLQNAADRLNRAPGPMRLPAVHRGGRQSEGLGSLAGDRDVRVLPARLDGLGGNAGIVDSGSLPVERAHAVDDSAGDDHGAEPNAPGQADDSGDQERCISHERDGYDSCNSRRSGRDNIGTRA